MLQSRTDNAPYGSTRNLIADLGIGGITNQAGLPAIEISGIQQIGNTASDSCLQDNQCMFALLDNIN